MLSNTEVHVEPIYRTSTDTGQGFGMNSLIRWLIGLALLIGLASAANVWLGLAGFGIWMVLSRWLRQANPQRVQPVETKTLGIEEPVASEGLARSLASLTFDKMITLAGEYESRMGTPSDPGQLIGMRLTLLWDPLVFCVIQYRLWAREILGDFSYRRFEATFDNVVITRLAEEAFVYHGDDSDRTDDGLMLAQSYREWLARRHSAYQSVLADKKFYGADWVDEVFVASMITAELVALKLTAPEGVLKALAREVVAETRNRIGQASEGLPRSPLNDDGGRIEF